MKPQRLAVLFVTALATAWTVVAQDRRPAVPPPPAGAPHVPADVTYLGAFQAPPNVDTSFSSGGLSGRQVNGRTHLYFYRGDVGVVEERVG